MTSARLFHLCKPGFESLLVRELTPAGGRTAVTGPGWVLSERVDGGAWNRLAEGGGLCFAHVTLLDPAELLDLTVNGMADKLERHVASAFRGLRLDAAWPLLFEAAAVEGIAGRVKVVKTAFLKRMGRKMGRVFKLATGGLDPRRMENEGLYVFFTDYGQAFAAHRFRVWGQRRMKDDPQAPSRSYLKVEEAYGILGVEPAAGESVADLGAAPGGWSYSAAKRGARVVAVDNGPLKGGAADQARIEHRCEDAFTFRPPPGRRFDWLFCDMIENPYRILELLETWVDNGWCRRFVVNLKFGHHDPVALLERLRNPRGALLRHGVRVKARQLHHDREEITLVGDVPA